MGCRRKLVILGAGDFGREVLCAAFDSASPDGEAYDPCAFMDDDPAKWESRVEGLPVAPFGELPGLADENTAFILGVGTPSVRMKLYESLMAAITNPVFATLIHPSVVIKPHVAIAEGAFVGPNTSLAVGAQLQAHCLVNQNCSIGHDTHIGRFSAVSPGCLLSGHTTIAEDVFFGSGVITFPDVSIGKGAIVGAGAVIRRDVPARTKVLPKQTHLTLEVENRCH